MDETSNAHVGAVFLYPALGFSCTSSMYGVRSETQHAPLGQDPASSESDTEYMEFTEYQPGDPQAGPLHMYSVFCYLWLSYSYSARGGWPRLALTNTG